MAKKAPFKSRKIHRREIPGYERGGSVAQELTGRDLLLVAFHQTKTEIHTVNGLEVEGLAPELYDGEPGPGVRDTVVVGFARGRSAIVLVDVVTIDGRSMRGKSWKDRMEALRLLCAGFSEDGGRRYQLARTWNRGLLRAFDEVIKGGGAGLLLRVPGKAQAIMCLNEDEQTDSSVGDA